MPCNSSTQRVLTLNMYTHNAPKHTTNQSKRRKKNQHSTHSEIGVWLEPDENAFGSYGVSIRFSILGLFQRISFFYVLFVDLVIGVFFLISTAVVIPSIGDYRVYIYIYWRLVVVCIDFGVGFGKLLFYLTILTLAFINRLRVWIRWHSTSITSHFSSFQQDVCCQSDIAFLILLDLIQFYSDSVLFFPLFLSTSWSLNVFLVFFRGFAFTHSLSFFFFLFLSCTECCICFPVCLFHRVYLYTRDISWK